MPTHLPILLARELRSWPPTVPAFDDLDGGSAAHDEPPRDLAGWIGFLEQVEPKTPRHSCPSVAAQLRASAKRPIDTVICSALDADPTSCLQSVVAAAHSQAMVKGVVRVAALVGAKRAIIIIDRAAPWSFWTDLRREEARQPIELIAGPNPYPQSDPTLLMFAVLNRRLRPGRLPVEQGTILLDAVAAAQLGGLELSTPVVVRDHRHQSSWFVRVPRSMQVGTLLERLDTPQIEQLELISGDILRKRRIELTSLVFETELVIHLLPKTPPRAASACIRCGWCFEACPTRVQPAMILDAAQQKDHELAENAGLHSCIECGVCSYVCPSRLPLLESIRSMK